MASISPPSDNELAEGDCAFCYRKCSSAKLISLNCPHYACLACACTEMVQGVFECSYCSTGTRILSVPSSSPPMDSMASQSICRQCSRGNPVVARCPDCTDDTQFLCADCVSSHTDMKYFRGHRLVTLSSNRDILPADHHSADTFCRRHGRQSVVSFCPECIEPMCHYCTMEDLPHITIHSTLPEAITHARAAFFASSQQLTAAVNTCETLQNRIQMNHHALRLMYDQAKGNIDAVTIMFVKAIEAKRVEEQRKLENLFVAKRLAMCRGSQGLRQQTADLKETVEVIKRKLLTENDVRLLESLKWLTAHTNSLMNYTPIYEDPAIEFSHNVKDDYIQTVINDTFGCIKPSLDEINPDLLAEIEFTRNSRRSSLAEYKSIGQDLAALNPTPVLGVPAKPWANLDSRASSSPEGGDIFSTADMFQCGVNRKSSDEMSLPRSSVIRQKISDPPVKFGEFGSGDGQFSEPSGVTVNQNNGNILITDTNNHRIEIFDRKGQFIYEIHKCGKDDGQLLYPHRITMCRLTGNIVILERNPTHQVHIYSQDGKFVRRFGGDILQNPRGVCVDGQGRVVVVECKVQRITVFDQTDGKVLHKWNCTPHLEFPVGVAANDKLKQIYIADNRAHCVKVFNYEGEYLHTIGGPGITNYPIGVGICPGGQIIVADNHNNFNLTIFTVDGQLIAAFEGRTKHQQCYDVMFADNGTVVLTCKDMSAYIYRCNELTNIGRAINHV